MFGTLAFIAVILIVFVGSLALRQRALNATSGRHRIAESAAKHRWNAQSCWKPVCGCDREHQLPPAAIIERLRREEARAGARYGIGGVRLATAI